MSVLYYGDDSSPDGYAVELYDLVEVRIDGHTYSGGIVRAIHPRSREVTVSYEDHLDCARTTGDPRRKRCRAHILAVDLIGRDG